MSSSLPRILPGATPNPHQDSNRPEASDGKHSASLKDSVLNPTTRVSMTRVTAAWGFGAAFTNITAGAVYTAFARGLGANDFIFGVLFASLPLMSFLQIIAAKLVEHSGKRKRQMLIAGLIGRGLWVVAAALPLIAEANPGWISKRELLNLVVCAILSAGAIQAFTSPAFFSWMTDLVPSRVRPSFFAKRMQLGTWAALMMTIASGLIADNFANMRVYCILLGVAGICGMIDIALFIGVHEPQMRKGAEEPKVKRQSPPMLDMIRVPLRDASIRRFLLFISVLMFAYGLQGPIQWLFVLEHLGLSKTMAGLLLGGVPLIAVALTTPFWGEVLRRYGNRPVMRFASMGIAFSSVGWLIARPGAWDVIPILLFLSSSFIGALDLSSQNLITGIAPGVPRSSIAALVSVAAGMSFAAAAWVGGALSQSLVWVNTSGIDWFGMPIVNYHMVFLISTGIRLANATFIAPLLKEPQASGTVETVKEIFPEMVEAFAARLAKPVGTKAD